MRTWRRQLLAYMALASIFLLNVAECKKKKPPQKEPNKAETNLFNFLRLVVYRLVYGFATMFGAQEVISEFMGGIFVPPGADEDGDYRDYYDDEGDKDYGGYDY